MQNEDCVKVTADLERVKVKSTVKTKGYIGKDLNRKILFPSLWVTVPGCIRYRLLTDSNSQKSLIP